MPRLAPLIRLRDQMREDVARTQFAR